MQASARLLAGPLRNLFLLRAALLAAGAILVMLLMPGGPCATLALLLSMAAETLGCYLFFVSVVPKNMAASYLGAEAA